MTEAGVARGVPMPWTLRLFEALPVPPVCVGIGITATLLAVYFGVEYATGQVDRVLAGEAPAHIPAHFLATVVNAALLGYLPTAQLYLARGTRRHLAELTPLLRAPEGRATGSPSEAGVLGSHASALVGLFMVFPADLPRYLRREYWIFEHTWDNVLTIPLGWLTGRFAYAMVADSRRFSRLAASLTSIDLFDLKPPRSLRAPGPVGRAARDRLHLDQLRPRLELRLRPAAGGWSPSGVDITPVPGPRARTQSEFPML